MRAISLLTIMLLASFCRAEDPDPFKLTPSLEYSLAGSSVLFNIMAQINFQNLEKADLESLNRSEIGLIDRWSADVYFPWADAGSDMFSAGLLVPFFISYRYSRAVGNFQPLVRDLVIFSEALSLSSALNIFVRSLGKKPRPLVYNPKVPLSEREEKSSSSSFYSGHASAAFLTAVYTGFVFDNRFPGSKLSKWVWSLSLTAAGTVGALRIAAGKHYFSDVAAGAAIGSLFGFIIPKIHLISSNSTRLSTCFSINGAGIILKL